MPTTAAEVQRTLGRIESKLDSLADTFEQHIRDDKDNFKGLDLRVSTVEKKLYTAAGALALLYGVVTWFK